MYAKLATVDQEKCKVLKRFRLDLMMDYDESVLSNERQISKMEIRRRGMMLLQYFAMTLN